MIQIQVEIEMDDPVHGKTIYQTPLAMHGEILALSESSQKELMIHTWETFKHDGRLIAFHIPVTTWNRIAIL